MSESTTTSPNSGSVLFDQNSASDVAPATPPATETAPATTETPATPATAASQTGEQPAAKAPESYAAFKLPDGITLDETALGKAQPLFQKYGLTQDAAQELVGVYADTIKGHEKALLDAHDAQVAGYATAAQADPEIVKEDQTFDQAKARSNLFIEKMGTPALRTTLDALGLTDHPEVMKAFAKVGRLLEQDAIRPGGREPTAPKVFGQGLFPNDRWGR